MEQQNHTLAFVALLIAIIAIAIAGVVWTNQSDNTFDSSALESAINSNALKISTEQGRTDAVNVAITTLNGKLNSINLGGGDVNRNDFDNVEDDIEDLEDDIDDLQDAIDCLEEYADDEDLDDLVDCLDDI